MSALAGLVHRFTVEEVLRWAERGMFEILPRVELLDGMLIDRAPPHDDHIGVTHHLARQLRQRVEPAWTVLEEKPLRVDAHNLPEPDVQVVRVPSEAVWGTPEAADVALVVEVAVNSRAIDMHKAEIYALGGVPLYWLVDVPRRVVIVWSEPQDGEYTRRETLVADASIEVPGGYGQIPIRVFLPR
jgi:Uma2 family endonuclease